MLPFPWRVRVGEVPADLLSADGSSTYWELAKVVSNAVRADPNTLELLFVPSLRATDPMGEWIVAEREAFLSSRIHASFGQYALSQLKKLKRSLRLAEHRDVVIIAATAASEKDARIRVDAVRITGAKFAAPEKSPAIHGDALVFERYNLVYLSLYTM